MLQLEYDRKQIEDVIDKIVKKTMNMDLTWDWLCGVAYYGISEAYEKTGKEEYLTLLKDRVDELISLGLPRAWTVNTCAMGHCLITLYNATNDKGYYDILMDADGAEGPLPAPAGADLTDMGHEFYPEGLAHVIRKVNQDYKGDIIVTENGVATEDDGLRVEFIRRAVDGVRKCVEDGIPVKGYLHWTLIDNYEWAKAYSVKFGLIAVGRSTQKRMPKPSLAYLGAICNDME